MADHDAPTAVAEESPSDGASDAGPRRGAGPAPEASAPPARNPRARSRRRTLTTVLLGIPIPILFLLVWHFGRLYAWELPFGIRMTYLPAPADVAVSFVDYLFGGIHDDAFSAKFWENLGASVFRVFSGFLLAAALAIPLGVFMGRSYTMHSLFDPFINLFRPIPATAWVPLVGLLIGYDDRSAIFLITLSAFFPIVLGAISGARQTPPRLIEAAQMLGSRPWRILVGVVLPASAPAIVNGLRVGLGLAWVVLVLGESVGFTSGLGQAIILARDVVRTDMVVVGMACIGLAGFLSDRLLMLAFRIGFGRRPLIK